MAYTAHNYLILTYNVSTFPSFPRSEPNETITHAIGNKLYLDSGKTLIDYSGGITGHNTIGWGNEEIAHAAFEQIKRIGHIDYKTFRDENREVLADKVIDFDSSNTLSRIYFVGGSGGEACEAAMKLSYQSQLLKGFSNKKIFISRSQSYHGSTSDTLSKHLLTIKT